MNERVHRYIDAEIHREDLSPEEEREAVALLGSSDRVVEHLRSVRPPDLTSRVMGALPDGLFAQQPVQARAGAAGWLWRPRTISFTYRPAFACGILAAAVIAFVILPSSDTATEVSAPAAIAAVGDSHMYVQFRLEAAEASDVRLAGSFTGWEPTVELSEVAPGVWSAMVPLDPGVHDYTFLVDGDEWVVDPNATNVEDSFGGMNSRLFLAVPLDAA